MDPIIARHLPLITNRIPFTFNPPSPLPPLTNRKEFLGNRELSATAPPFLPNKASPLKYSGSVAFAFQKGGETENADKGKGAEEEREDEERDEAIESTTLIPKPSGEPGRPHSGGYSLDDVLSPWGVATLAKVTTFIKDAADKDLDTTVSYSKQDIEMVNDICKAASARFSVLTKYANFWPVRDILKLHLKYTSESHRKNEAPKKKPQRPKRNARAKTPFRDVESEESM